MNMTIHYGNKMKKFKIPQGIGTKWTTPTSKYIHGPRVKQPEKFKKIYTVSIDWARERGLKLTHKPRSADKVVVGVLKRTKKLAVQSYLTSKR